MKPEKDSYNLIITGVGGQGNVLCSQLIGQAFVRKGFFATIGETYGASQRGGSVMSHIRLSSKKQLSPLISKGRADVVVALEPVEALRVLTQYGNPETVVLVNTRPIYPVDVISGNEAYPDFAAIEKMIDQQVVVTTGSASDGGEKIKRKIIKFTVGDIVFTGAYYLDKTFIYLPIEAIQKAVQPGEDGKVADQIQIKLAEGVAPEASLEGIRQIWSKFAKEHLGWNGVMIEQTGIATSKQMQAQYVAEFRKQMDILMLIFGVVSLSVVMLIFCIFYMIVVTRLKDIAIIKSCGATDFSAGIIFFGFGGCVGIGGGILGTIIAAIITRNINVIEGWIRILFGMKLWTSSTYMFSKIPNQMDWSAAMPILIFAVAAAALGALVPAIIAARTRPVEVLRYE